MPKSLKNVLLSTTLFKTSHNLRSPHLLYGLLAGFVFIVYFTGFSSAQIHFAGDLNNDLRVDLEDVRILGRQWLDPGCLTSDCTADIDGTDGVNMADLALLAMNWRQGPKVIINEIHYDPAIKTELSEFVELYNAGTMDANISGWYFSDGISYQFPAETILPVGGYVVVAQNPYTIHDIFDTPSNLIYGPFDFGVKLENDGEEVKLRNAEGMTMDTVDYRLRFPWPIVGDPPGNSIEQVNPHLDNDLGGSWRPSEPDAVAPPTTIIPASSNWRYFKGYSEASNPVSAWREIDFVDTSWSTGDLPIGYGEGFITTYLSDMQDNYSSIFLRKKFELGNPSAVSNLKLFAIYDDGFNVWINGESVLPPINVADEEMPYTGTAGSAREDFDWNEFNLSVPAGCLVSGTNVLAIQLFNSSLSSSTDCFLDVALENVPAVTTAGPTPGTRNTTYSLNIPPHMRQVTHTPKQPQSNEDVKITVKVTDPDGVESVSLSYQLVYPGSYIELNDAEYETNWTSLPMTDNGTSGDEYANDSIYTVVVPGSLHTHRMLVRYRITATDKTGLSVTGPYAHDPQPNFAYFVYDGVPDWYGAIDADNEDPLLSKIIYYGSFSLTKVPVYHLISKKDSVEHAIWLDKYGGDLYKWYGTLVYDGEVYDHIRYRARGGVWRYAMGKNMWKFDFNRGHYFQARDDYGKKYDTTWDKLNFSACIQQGSFGQRGEQGMFEALTFMMFNMAGVPAPKTHYIHFRVIDEPYEDGHFNAAHYPITSSGTQYDGDFWGLYLVLEQMDGRFLDEHGLPDGNLYKMEEYYGELNNQGLTAVTDKSDIIAFKDTFSSYPPADWWGENVNIESYYGYRAVYLAAHHGDITSKNHFFYLNPETTTNEWGTNNLWWQLPWDVDLTWTTYYGTMSDPFSRSNLLTYTNFSMESKNRIREFCDLLFNTEQMYELINEFAAIIDPSGSYSIADADRAMWDYHWVMGPSAYPTYLSHEASFKAGQGRFYEEAEEQEHNRTFPGMVQVMKDYISIGLDGRPPRYTYMLAMASDYDIPYTPTIAALCGPNYPINDLRFITSAFNDPQGIGTFAAMKWRIAEVTDISAPTYDATERRKYEIETVWESGEITDFNNTITIPASVVKIGHAYRVRVRMKDETGRWSHWSNRIHFIVGEPLSANVLNNLRITEVMYNPGEAPEGDPNDNDNFEFIELKNIHSETIDLTYVSFVDGISFDFNDSSVTSLDSNDFVLVVRNKSAFESRYGTDFSDKIAGEYQFNLKNNLDNGGDKIKLRDYWNGTITEFEYNDSRGWPLSADGAGHSLVPLDSAIVDEPNGSLNYSGNWRASTYIGGSPAQDDPVFITSVVINEFMANTDYFDPLHLEYDSNDWIELYNTTGAGISLENWYLSDDKAELQKWAIPGTLIPAYGRVSFDEVTGFHNPIHTGFGLSTSGEEVILSHLPGTSQDRVVDCIEFKGQESDVSYGRYPDGGKYWFRLTPSRDSANFNPIQDVLIEEIMYHPAGVNEDNLEYIELYNPTAEDITLQNFMGTWRLNGAVEYPFPFGTTIPSDSRIVVVPFNPLTELDELSDFLLEYDAYHLIPDVNIVGPWFGQLSNESERIALEKPQITDDPDNPSCWVILDEITYFDQIPWPETPDGNGESLRRINSDQYHSGNDPLNWKADIPSPGEPNWAPPDIPPPPPPP